MFGKTRDVKYGYLVEITLGSESFSSLLVQCERVEGRLVSRTQRLRHRIVKKNVDGETTLIHN